MAGGEELRLQGRVGGLMGPLVNSVRMCNPCCYCCAVQHRAPRVPGGPLTHLLRRNGTNSCPTWPQAPVTRNRALLVWPTASAALAPVLM